MAADPYAANVVFYAGLQDPAGIATDSSVSPTSITVLGTPSVETTDNYTSCFFPGSPTGLEFLGNNSTVGSDDFCFELRVLPHPSPVTTSMCLFSSSGNMVNSGAPGAPGAPGAGVGGKGDPGDEATGGFSPNATSGSFGQGGDGSQAGSLASNGGGGGGGGGGGYYGGGGGSGSGGWWGNRGGSGGGGSNYVDPSLGTPVSLNGAATFLSPAGVSGAGHSGNGHCRITNLATSAVTDFSYTGAPQTFTAPSPDQYKIEVWGAQGTAVTTGAIVPGGKGGYASAVIALTAGETLSVYVGGQAGYNGGGAGGASGSETGRSGGGATDVRRDSTLESRLIVAGGGGGAGGVGSNGYGGASGTPGGAAGCDGLGAAYPALSVWCGNKAIWFDVGDGPTSVDAVLSTVTPNHFAITRAGSTFRVFVNGVLVKTFTKASAIGTFATCRVGFYKDTDGSYKAGALCYFNGWLDNVRITRGVPRYTESFTPKIGILYAPIQYNGDKALAGVVTMKGSVVPGASVNLFAEATNRFLKSQVADAAGRFRFEELNDAYEYFILIKAPGNLWEHVVTCRRKPV